MGNTMIDRSDDAVASRPEPNLGWVVAGLSAGAAIIHFGMTPIHGGGQLVDPLGFALAGIFQLVVAAMIVTDRGGKRVYEAAILGNLALIGLWIWSRTVGLPIGDHKGIVEPVGSIDLICVLLQVGVILVAGRILLAGSQPKVGRLAPALCAVAALGLATTAITSSDAATHTHGATVDPVTALKKQIDAKRCDTAFNIPAYWSEAEKLGIDTRMGGTINDAAGGSAAPVNESQPHTHSGGASVAVGGTTTTTTPDPTQGRGSEELDQLISDTTNAANGEGAAASLIGHLSEATQKQYDSWLWWLRASGNVAHAHATATTAAAVGDGAGHGGHVGPQLWTALTDQEQCDRLARELKLARDTAMKFPTVADAMKAGYVMSTPYVPGIAAHYIKYSLIDGKFEIDKPEMILYDGTDPNSHVVGLSYYLWHDGTAEPTQGFTGFNDHGHQHLGLCNSKDGTVIGDSTLTDAQCAAIGGTKASGSKGWMYHAWVVPGCESPWGVFSAATPVLDHGVTASSGKDGGHCAGSYVRERYGLRPEKRAPGAAKTAAEDNRRRDAEREARREVIRRAREKASEASATKSDKPVALRKAN
jgi:hypothetical protein